MSLHPISIGFENSGAYPWQRVGATNSRILGIFAVNASLAADVDIFLGFEAPQTLPSGTPKLRLIGIANATSGNAVFNPAWASIAVGAGENFDTFTLNAEGNSTLTWSTGNNDDLMELLITLDADTIVADEVIYIALTAVSASWTLASRSTWMASVIWQ